jgi:hypothetical protein
MAANKGTIRSGRETSLPFGLPLSAFGVRPRRVALEREGIGFHFVDENGVQKAWGITFSAPGKAADS